VSVVFFRAPPYSIIGSKSYPAIPSITEEGIPKILFNHLNCLSGGSVNCKKKYARNPISITIIEINTATLFPKHQ
jgi:hypothetical protein